jgi:general secretion pathway protein M
VGILLLVILITFTLNMAMRYQRYQADIERMLPRMAQLEGIFQAQERINSAVTSVRDEVANYLYPPDADDAALNSEIQNRARSAFAEAGMQVAGSQILPPRPTQTFNQLMLDLSATGSLESLEAALHALEQTRPRLLIDSIRIEPVRNVRDTNTQSVQINLRLLALRGAER